VQYDKNDAGSQPSKIGYRLVTAARAILQVFDASRFADRQLDAADSQS
jgi:hypothetical protein